MSLQFSQIKDLIANQIGDDATDTDTDIGRYVNLAARDVYYAHLWPERLVSVHKRTIETQTVTDAVVAANGTALTSAGNELDTGWVRRKITTTIGQAFGVFSAVASTGAATLEAGWPLTALAGAATAYVYDDRVALPADVRTLNRVTIMDEGDAYELMEWPRRMAVGTDLLPEGTGRPLLWRWDQEVGGTKYIQLGPYVPDQVYTVVIDYWKTYTDMSSASDTCDVPDERIDLVLVKALSWIYQRDHFARAMAMGDRYNAMLRDHIAADSPSYGQAGRLGVQGSVKLGPDFTFDSNDLVIS